MRSTSNTRNTKPVRGIVRQGDVLLLPVDELPAGRHRTLPGGVVAEGEATGHAHAITGPARVVTSTRRGGAGDLFVVVHTDGATLRHEEHDPITLAAGVYRVVRQREYAPRPVRTAGPSWRAVAD
jgi:hypothetical protein